MADPGGDRRDAAEWQRLHEIQRQLRIRIGQADNPETRAELQHQLVENRLALARLESGTSGDDPAPALIPTASETSGSVGGPEDDGDIDKLIDSLTTPGGLGGKASGRIQPRFGPRWRTSLVAIGLVGVLLSVGLSWLAFSRSSDDDVVEATGTETTEAVADQPVEAIRSVLTALGFTGIEVTATGNEVHLEGRVDSDADRATAISAAEALLASGATLDTSELVVGTAPVEPTGGDDQQARVSRFQTEIDRVLATTPLIFAKGSTDLTELQQRILNSVATVMAGYPDLAVTVVGYTDHAGDPEANRQLSLSRAGNVKAYLVAQGVAAVRLVVEARGEDSSTGSDALASLERRVEFEVAVAPAATPAAPASGLRIAIVAPSARNDLAFTQSMVDAVNTIATERGNVEVTVADNLFVPAEAAAAIRGFADEGYDLVIAHGVEFGSELITIVTDHPDTTFAWGTATDTFGLPNLYAYDAAAEQGGYVLGAMSRRLSTSQVIGVVGPIEVGDAQRYVKGFQAGAEAESPKATVAVTYTGSFSDIALAAEVATSQLAAGADVLTGTGELVVGAVSVAQANGALWFGTQSSQASLAPEIVVASQIYRWEVVLRPIIADLDAGVHQGRGLVADLANGGLVIEHNPTYALPPEVRQRADELTAQIVAGTLVVPRS